MDVSDMNLHQGQLWLQTTAARFRLRDYKIPLSNHRRNERSARFNVGNCRSPASEFSDQPKIAAGVKACAPAAPMRVAAYGEDCESASQ
jgi:hypothetical protein